MKKSINVIAFLAILYSLVPLQGTPEARADGAEETSAAASETVVKPLTLETIEIQGGTRTRPEVVRAHMGLRPGAAIDQADLLDGVARLRESGIFETVDFYTRPGSRRGALILVLDVTERGARLSLGTGNTDLDGWYLIPAALDLDNLSGRGEHAGVQSFLGYRTSGVEAFYRRGDLPGDRVFWGAQARFAANERVYFRDGVEYEQPTTRGGLELYAGRRLSDTWSLSLALRTETVEVDSTGSVRMDAPHLGLEARDDVPFEDLPAGIADAVGQRTLTVVHADLEVDTRSRARRIDTPISGLWGRARIQHTRDGEVDYAAAGLDLRAYRGLGAGVLTLRGRAVAVAEDAPFYDRYYLGGLYTLRGVPSQSLSPPRGHNWLWHGSLEYRAPLLGESVHPRMAGLLFLDTGNSGDIDGAGGDPAASVGWGLRLRVGKVGYLGIDFGLPLSDSPVDEAFHAHASLGWNF